MAKAITAGKRANKLKTLNLDNDHCQRHMEQEKKIRLDHDACEQKGKRLLNTPLLDEWQRLLPTASISKPAVRPVPIRPKLKFTRVENSESHLKITESGTLSPLQARILFPTGVQPDQTGYVSRPDLENMGTLCETVLLVPAAAKPVRLKQKLVVKSEPENMETRALVHAEHLVAELQASLAALERENAALREEVLEKTALAEKLNTHIGTLHQKEQMLADLREKMDALQQDNIALRQEVQEKNAIVEKMTTSQSDFENDPAKLKFYTGITSWEAFMDIFNTLSPSLSGTQKLSKFCRVLMFFFKLRLNLRDEDLAYRFNVAQATVSRNIRAISDVIACHPDLRSFCDGLVTRHQK